MSHDSQVKLLENESQVQWNRIYDGVGSEECTQHVRMSDCTATVPEIDHHSVYTHPISIQVIHVSIRPTGNIPCRMYAARVVCGIHTWEIQFALAELVYLHIQLLLLSMYSNRKHISFPWALCTRRFTRQTFIPLVQTYLNRTIHISGEVHQLPRKLQSFLHLSRNRLQSHFGPSIREDYAHIRVHGAVILPFRTSSHPILSIIIRHLYHTWIRIAFSSCNILVLLPALFAMLASLSQFITSRQDSDSFHRTISKQLLIRFCFLFLFILAILLMCIIFQNRMGKRRQWVVLKHNYLAAYTNCDTSNANRVFLFDKSLLCVKGNWKQGVLYMPSGCTVQCLSGFMEIDFGHHCMQLSSILSLAILSYCVILILPYCFAYRPLPIEHAVPTNGSILIDWKEPMYCGYSFIAPWDMSIEGPEHGTLVTKIIAKDDGQMYRKADAYYSRDYMFFGPVFAHFARRGQRVAILKRVVNATSLELILAEESAIRIEGMLGSLPHKLMLSAYVCKIPINIARITGKVWVRIAFILIAMGFLSSALSPLFSYLLLRLRSYGPLHRRDEWFACLSQLQKSHSQSIPNRYDSFAKCHGSPSMVQWLIDGKDIFGAMYHGIQQAQREIFIAGWWLCPDLFLLRTSRHSHSAKSTEQELDISEFQLREILLQRARSGIQIYILLYREFKLALTLNSKYTKKRLQLHENIHIVRDPKVLQMQNIGFWSHHEKIVCIDQKIAFVGGLDLCFGRYDFAEHPLSDGDGRRKETQIWVGKDYSNPIIRDFVAVHEPFKDSVDRSCVPRMPWHDVHCCVKGIAAMDIAMHFIQRWNFVACKNLHRVNLDRYICFRRTRIKAAVRCILPVHKSAYCEMQQQQGEYRMYAQVTRSVCAWSAGVPVECSIQKAYIDVIRSAKHYIYIENQFFISGMDGNTTIRNRIVQALVDRIKCAILANEVFRVYVFMPLLPAFECNIRSQKLTNLHAVLHWQFKTICRGKHSLFAALKLLTPDPEKYIAFFGLRNYGILPNGSLSTEQIYVHSKVLIADDRIVILGSANINDRSMLGSRDSEIALVLKDSEMVVNMLNKESVYCGRGATALRTQLFTEHFGTFLGCEAVDPCSDRTWETIRIVASRNTRIYDRVFHCAPSNELRSFASFDSIEITEFYENQRLCFLAKRNLRAWDARYLRQDDYAAYTDVNGVPIPVERIQFNDFRIADVAMHYLASSDEEGWHYARNFKVFQELRAYPGERFERSTLGDRIFWQVRRRCWVKVAVVMGDDAPTSTLRGKKKLKVPLSTNESCSQGGMGRAQSFDDVTCGSFVFTSSGEGFCVNGPSSWNLTQSLRQKGKFGGRLGLGLENRVLLSGSDLCKSLPEQSFQHVGINVSRYRLSQWNPQRSSGKGTRRGRRKVDLVPSDCQMIHVQTSVTIPKEERTCAPDMLVCIQGHAVEFPFYFLDDEMLKPSILPADLHI